MSSNETASLEVFEQDGTARAPRAGDVVLFREHYGEFAVLTLASVSEKTVSLTLPGTTFARKRFAKENIVAVFAPSEFDTLQHRVNEARRLQLALAASQRVDDAFTRRDRALADNMLATYVERGGVEPTVGRETFLVVATDWPAVMQQLVRLSPLVRIVGVEPTGFVMRLNGLEVFAIRPYTTLIEPFEEPSR